MGEGSKNLEQMDIHESQGIESKEGEQKEHPALTVYLIRHGESGKDKTDPKRGLTDNGREQVKLTFGKIIDQIITDEVPEFKDWDNVEAKQQVLQQALNKVELHICDSKTDRTWEQDWVEHDMLADLGVKEEQINMPKSAYEWKGVVAPTKAGPGVEKRLKGIRGLAENPNFRKQLSSKEYQKSLGARDEIIAWALTDEDEIPTGVESKDRMTQRMEADLGRVENVVKMRMQDNSKRVVYIANSHASIISLAASKELGIPLDKLGEVDNAEGLRLDFYVSGKALEAQPLGNKIELNKVIEDVYTAIKSIEDNEEPFPGAKAIIELGRLSSMFAESGSMGEEVIAMAENLRDAAEAYRKAENRHLFALEIRVTLEEQLNKAWQEFLQLYNKDTKN